MAEAAEPVDPDHPVVPGYVVEREIDASPNHHLYRCRRLGDGARFLLKTPRHEGRDAAAQLEQEFDIGRGLEVAGIVKARELVLTGARAALLLEDPGGQPLDRLLDHGPLDPLVVLACGRQLADTLARLHDHGLIHRDIQPCHVLVDLATRHVALGGLGCATSVPREAPGIGAGDRSGANLAYFAPEQTGRINYLVDYRTDLYALGVLLFTMLTGRPPFIADHPLDLMYAHIAQPPPSPTDLAPDVPRAVSAIVLKLMAKAPEERYQSGHGLGQDLERCLGEIAATGGVPLFELGRHDVPVRFELPRRLYGRDLALTRLTQTFDGMASDPIQVLLVSGYAGIGKTSLLQEFCQRVHFRGGYVIRGKYHELERDTPYRGFHEATADLVRQLLGDAPDRLDGLRTQLGDALGANVGVLVEVFPELGTLVGDAPPVAALGPAEARNRLLVCIQRFLGLVTSKDHPLVLFLDDLQWIDSASLELLERLLTTTLDSILLIGAYRDHEVDPDHPLMQSMERVRAQGVAVETVRLGPLGRDELEGLIVDALRTDAGRAAPLADLLYKKTAGNPLFAKSFLASAHHEGLIWLEPGSGWNWNLPAIGAMEATDNVIELITQRLGRLPERSRQAIMLAAALGSSFDAPLLALASDRPVAEIEADLTVACQNGIALKQGAAYQFVHDRVRASAYDLIPEGARPATHLRIGRLLTTRADEPEPDARLFDLVHHLNRAAPLLEAAEREAAARANQRAGQRAVATGAFREAFHYFRFALTLLGTEAWREQYALAVALHCEAAEAARLVADFAEADRLAQVACRHARTVLDAVPAHETRVSVAIAQSGEEEGCRLAFEILELLGVEMIPNPGEQDAREAFLAAHDLLDTLPADADQLSPMTDPSKLAAMRILTRIVLAASLSHVHLYEMTVCKLVDLTAAYGHSPESALAYVLMSGLRCRILGDSESGYRAGISGLTLIDRLGATAVKSLAHVMFDTGVLPWRMTPRDLLAPMAEARRLGLETGDFLSATTAAFCQCFLRLWGEGDLLELTRALRDFHLEAIALGQRPVLVVFESLEAVLEELMGKSSGPSVPDRDQPRDGESQPHATRLRHSNVYYGVTSCELWSHLLFRRHDRARASTLQAPTDRIGTAPAIMPWEFLCGLAILGGDDQRSVEEQSQLRPLVESLQQRLERRALAAPHTYRHRAALVAAEHARRLGRTEAAMMQYQEAIEAAHASGFLLEEALANELAAEFCLAGGRRHLAAMNLQAAATAYGRWGARAKVAQLREHYREFLGPGGPMASSPRPLGIDDGGAPAGGLELASIERAAGALAQQLDLAELLHRLLSILLHHTGAQRGVLLRVAADGLFVEASASVDRAEHPAVLNRPLETCDDLPQTVVRYVSRSAELVLGDTAQDGRFSRDAYLVHARPRSLLCAPVQHGGALEAIIYLEHRQLPSVFGEERVAAVQLIASQAAGALENARLHADLKEEIAQRQRVEEALRQALHETATLKDRLQAENLYLQEEIKGTHDFHEMIGESGAWRRVLFKVEQVAATDASVLLLGETGTGKELIARALHGRSRRQAHPLVKVNCAALPSTLIESELFGHERGAFTGALARKKGRFELADGGTLFLDEIGDLPLELQAKLLRVLQEGEFERLGSAQTLTVNVRIIAATNRDLAQAVRAGVFRADLYYRLNVFPIELPPLRARSEDLPLLVRYFVTKHQRKLGEQITHIPDDVMQALTAYAWPGNVRELENVIERALILSPRTALRVDEPFVSATSSWTPASDTQRLEDLERNHIGQVLAACGRRIKGKGGAAEQLGMKPSTLYTRMKKLGMVRTPSGPATTTDR